MIRAISRPFSALSLEVDSTIAPGEAPTAKLDPGQTPPACAHYGNWWVLAAQVGPAERDHMPKVVWSLSGGRAVTPASRRVDVSHATVGRPEANRPDAARGVVNTQAVVLTLSAVIAAVGTAGCSSDSRRSTTGSVPATSGSPGASAPGQNGSQSQVESSIAMAPSSGSTNLVTCLAGELSASMKQAPSPPQQENEWLISISKNAPGQCALGGWPILIGTNPGGASVVIPTSRDTTDAWPAAEPVSQGHPSTIAVIDHQSCDPSGAVPPAGASVLFRAIRIKLVSGTVPRLATT